MLALLDTIQVFLLVNLSLPLTGYLPAVTPYNKKVTEVTLLLNTVFFLFYISLCTSWFLFFFSVALQPYRTLADRAAAAGQRS